MNIHSQCNKPTKKVVLILGNVDRITLFIGRAERRERSFAGAAVHFLEFTDICTLLINDQDEDVGLNRSRDG